MVSAALLRWQSHQSFRLSEIEAQCAASLAIAPSQPDLVDENLRGFVLLLSAHFQGFCRDLYSECALVVVSKVKPSLQVLIQAQFTAQRKLDYGNPNFQNLKQDFERFGFHLDLDSYDPSNALRLHHLAEMNKWRNVAAHHGTVPSGSTPLSLPLLQTWRTSCDGLAVSLDGFMYDGLKKLLKRSPW